MQPDVSNQSTKTGLKTWWNQFPFTQKVKKENESSKTDDIVHTVFGKPLRESLKYASVQISTAGTNGELYVWGYIPVVVAKCGLYLKEHATEVAGTFRVNGSNKRMRELQAKFESPPRYGKSIDWKKETYTTHDVASVFRRYLTQMPEPVIPYDMYHLFRDALANPNYNQDEVISTYKRLMRKLPRPNQFLLLYVLDLLSVFARKSDKNLMTAANLAVIFRPGLISHPNHELSPGEHALSQRVLEFLIAQQDWLMLDIPTTDTASLSTANERQLLINNEWKVVGGERPTIPRRQTTMESSDDQSGLGEMSPAPENTSGIQRSRTLPSRKKGAPPEGEERARVLRKQKRASTSHPSSHRGGTPDNPKG